MEKEWLEAAIETTSEGIEPISDRLIALGVGGFSVEDGKAFTEFLENNRLYWDYVDESLLEKQKDAARIKLYVTNDEEGRMTLDEVRAALHALRKELPGTDLGSLSMGVTVRREEEWADNWKQYYKPVEIGKRLLIRPEWEPIPEGCDRVVFTVNPGMSFGTGTHSTTKLCIEELEKHIQAGDRMLDLGCGSGILSIIALLLGAKEAVAVDVDPYATEIAAKNAEMNGFGPDRYRTRAGDVLTDSELREFMGGGYDVVAANIVADVIIALAGTALEQLRPDGLFIASGIISERLAEVETAIREAGLETLYTREDGGWAAVVSRRPGK